MRGVIAMSVRLRQQSEPEPEPAPEPRAPAVSIGTLPLSVNLVLYQGDDFFLNVMVIDETGSTDLTGFTVKSVARAKIGDTTVLATFAGTVLDPTTVRLHLTSTESTKLVDKAVWDVQVSDPAGVVTTLVSGIITLAREVTT